MAKRIVIIGAGVAGLSAGTHLQRNGFETEIYEMNTVPGGLCCFWERNGYKINGCLHWLVGSGPGHSLYKLWNELIDMGKESFFDHEEFVRYEDGRGKAIAFYTDVDRLEEELLSKAPEDERLIRAFTKAVRKLRTFAMDQDKAPELMNLFDGLKMMVQILPRMGILRKWMRLSLEDLGKQCRNPLLAKAFSNLFVPEMAVLFVAFTLAWMHDKTSGYLIGGSERLARLLQKAYLESGGKIHYGRRVKKIFVEEGQARGILLESGDRVDADLVISAADGHATIFEMLEERYLDAKVRDLYENHLPFSSYLQVSLGVARTFEDVPYNLFFPLEAPLVLDPETTLEDLSVNIFSYDPTLAPQGKTALVALLHTRNTDHWRSLRKNDREKYRAEKKRIADGVVEALEKRFGGIRETLEMTDVSTPATVVRYTGNWKGSFEGWILTPKMGMRRIKKTLPGLEGFYMIGHWVEPGGGLPTALMSGRYVAQIICKAEKQPFVTQ